VLHVLIVFGIGYPWVGLNPTTSHMQFVLSIAWIGTCAFQALVCAAAFASDSPGPVYGTLFLLVGMGSLFGGLMVSWSNIVGPLRWCYYVAINALQVMPKNTTSTEPTSLQMHGFFRHCAHHIAAGARDCTRKHAGESVLPARMVREKITFELSSSDLRWQKRLCILPNCFLLLRTTATGLLTRRST
jgi:hypothetical protein